MSRSEKIGPALTPDEWTGTIPSATRGGLTIDTGAFLLVCDSEQEVEVVADEPEQRHAIAALALHGQSFGFTQDDVEYLHGVADWARENGLPDESSVWAEGLAARISALLPPLGETDARASTGTEG